MHPFLHPMFVMLFVASGAFAGEPDLGIGEDINQTCAACHGESGQGGKQGEYPRLAGMSAKYIAQQLRAFRDRTRVNIPMIPFTEQRELPDEDIIHVAAYLESIQLPNRMPNFKKTDDSLARLKMAAKVMQVPRAEGDLEKGAALFEKSCGTCHGKDGSGKGVYPALRGQYTQYLDRQLKQFVNGTRIHEQDEPGPSLINRFGATELRDILAYISTLDD